MPEFVTLEVSDGIGTIRLDRPPMNALNRQVQEELRRGRAGGDRARRRQVGDRLRRREGVRRRRRHQGMAEMDYVRDDRAIAGDLQSALGLDRRRSRSRPSRRSPATRSAVASKSRSAPTGGSSATTSKLGVTRDPARHDPRRRRHTAPRPAGRAGQGQGHRLHRPVRRGRTRRWRSGWSTRSWHRTTCTTRPADGPRSSSAAASRALAAAKAAIDEGLDTDLETGLKIEEHLFAALFATEDRTIGMASFIANGPGKAEFIGE